MTFADVKPAVRFLGIFLGCYLSLSLLYGLWIEAHDYQVDYLTREVSNEVALLVSMLGEGEVNAQQSSSAPTVFLMEGERVVLEVFEGCNGVNVMIVFLSFVFAFGGHSRWRITLFIAGGLGLIHLANLARLIGLYALAFGDRQVFHYYHKYFFTAVLYLLVFVLWWLWIQRWSGLKKEGDGRQ